MNHDGRKVETSVETATPTAFLRALEALRDCGLDLQGPTVVRTAMSERVRRLPPEQLLRLVALRVLRTVDSAKSSMDAPGYAAWLEAIASGLGRDLDV
jgi:hypothetical protein